MAAKYVTPAELAELFAGLHPQADPHGRAQCGQTRRLENPLGRGLPLRKGAGEARRRTAAATAYRLHSVIILSQTERRGQRWKGTRISTKVPAKVRV